MSAGADREVRRDELASGENGAARVRRNGVQVIARAAEILRLLAAAPEGLSLSELATRVELARSTVHRIVRALDQEGFIRSTTSGKLRIGPGLVGLAVSSRQDLRQEAGRYLERLSQELHETVDLAVLDGGQVLFIDQYTSPGRVLRIVSEIGARFPLYCTANGKALLAALPPSEAEKLLPERLKPLTKNTITSRKRLLEELAEIRAKGVAYDREEHSEGISAAGTAVRDALGNLAAITVVTPTTRFEQSEERITKALLKAKDEIQAALGQP